MKNIIVLLGFVGLLSAVAILGGMVLMMPDAPNVCTMSYNSAMADLVHVKIKVQQLEQQIQRMQQGPECIRGWGLWNI